MDVGTYVTLRNGILEKVQKEIGRELNANEISIFSITVRLGLIIGARQG